MTRTDEIKQLLGMSESENTAIVTITPKIAKQLLEYNTHNRPRQESRIRDYAEDMKKGKWYLSESAIGFDADGVLTNGQTRLEACTIANVSFESIVCIVLEQNIHMDTGNVRKVVDNIVLNEAVSEYMNVNQNSLKVVCELIRIKNCNKRVTPEPVVEFCRKYGMWIDKAYEEGLLILQNSNAPGLSRVQTAAAFLIAYINGVDISKLKHIRTVLTNGISSDNNDIVIIGLRDKLMRMSSNKSTADRKIVYLATQSCINSYINRRCLRVIHTDREYFPIRL